MTEREKVIYFFLFFIITISLVCHLLFSWIGFNPTDEGFILSLSRRILDGEIPHKDFIYIRPALTPVIHMPVVYLGGDYTFWFSRYFVWAELASISCIWVYILAKKFFFIPFEKYLYFFLTLICFVFSVYSAFVMAHTTYDALLFYSLGLFLCLRNSESSVIAGCFVIGLSYLCRQNFILLMPITLVVLGYWRNLKYWAAVILPAVLYILLMLILGSVNDLFIQIASAGGKFHGGLKIFVTNPGFWLSIPAGYILMHKFFISENQNSAVTNIWKRLMIISVLIIASVLFLNTNFYPHYISFCFFGLVLGAVIFMFRIKEYEYLKYGILLLGLAWCTSISIGMSYPALISGQLFLFTAILLSGINLKNYIYPFTSKLKFKIIYALIVLFIVSGFGYARYMNVYRDREASELNYNAGSILMGAERLNTNENTYMFLEDLQRAIVKAGDKNFCILPDAACYWVKSVHENPLPISWANKTEIGNDILFEKIINRLESDDSIVIILEKVMANSLYSEFLPMPKDETYSPVVKYVISNYKKYDETKYFEIYRRDINNTKD